MRYVTRRETVRALSGGLTLPLVGTAAARGNRLETLVALPGEEVPENLALSESGDLYFGVVGGAVRRVPADRTDATGLSLGETDLVATLPGNVVGVELGPDGTVYVASHAGDDTGVWAIPPEGDPRPLAAVPGFPNDVLYDPDHRRLLVTESLGGVVHEVRLDDADPTAARWADVPALDTDGLGANGLAFRDGELLVAVTQGSTDGTDVGRLVRIAIEPDGSAGTAASVREGAELLGADGVTTVGPHTYVTANARDELVRVSPGDTTHVVADADDGLSFPSDVLAGPDSLFVCNFARNEPAAGAVFRLRGR